MTNQEIDFKSLKKELKDIEKLTKDNLDIKTWASEIQLWIELEEVTNPKKIFIACVLTSTGEPRKVIQELKNNLDNYDSDDEDEDNDESDNESNDENDTSYPTFSEIIDALETFYGIKEDQNLLVREIRSLRIKRNEKVKDFNTRFRSLYLKLDKKHKKQVSVLDYVDSLRNNEEAWKRVSLQDDISLKQAYEAAEKVDRLMINQTRLTNQENYHRNNYNSNNTFKRNSPSIPYNKKLESEELKRTNVDVEREDLTSKMKHLTIKTCFYCEEKGHYSNHCPKLQSIIQENKRKYFNQNHNMPLNQ